MAPPPPPPAAPLSAAPEPVRRVAPKAAVETKQPAVVELTARITFSLSNSEK